MKNKTSSCYPSQPKIGSFCRERILILFLSHSNNHWSLSLSLSRVRIFILFFFLNPIKLCFLFPNSISPLLRFFFQFRFKFIYLLSRFYLYHLSIVFWTLIHVIYWRVEDENLWSRYEVHIGFHFISLSSFYTILLTIFSIMWVCF